MSCRMFFQIFNHKIVIKFHIIDIRRGLYFVAEGILRENYKNFHQQWIHKKAFPETAVAEAAELLRW